MIWLPACGNEAMQLVARAVATHLRDGDAVLLEGPVGAGKTTLASAVCTALGSSEPATSPTYTVGHVYSGAGGRTIAHLDLYRGAPISEDAWADLAEYFRCPVLLVEWPGGDISERLGGRRVWKVRIDHVDHASRVVGIATPDAVTRTELLADVATLAQRTVGEWAGR